MSSNVQKGARKKAPRTRAKKPTGAIETAKNSLSLMVLSPYRLPVDPERLVTHAARLGGFAFVFCAIVFSYTFIESTATKYMVDVAQTASVSAAVASPRTPNVTFAYRSLETDGYAITVTVSDAESVVLHAFDPAEGEYHRLGDAHPISQNTWKYDWYTNAVPPGDYWLKALVTNTYGMYDRSDSHYLKVE